MQRSSLTHNQLIPVAQQTIHKTGYDIPLMGKHPLPGSKNSVSENFADNAGYPRALLVPNDWAYPLERKSIEPAYPGFEIWRMSAGLTASDWYFNVIVELVFPVKKEEPYNPETTDTDGDGIVDAIDNDDDNDGVIDSYYGWQVENCPLIPNPINRMQMQTVSEMLVMKHDD